MPLSKREIRQRSSELNVLVYEWDPIGVAPDGPRDEYECLVGPLLTMLQSGATQSEIASYLETELIEHFGLVPNRDNIAAAASRVRAWFDRGWKELVDPVTIFVALLDEGTDVWRPVQARPLGADFYRIIGVEADVSDETWQFSPGAIVRCEPKRLNDGQVSIVAVELKEAG